MHTNIDIDNQLLEEALVLGRCKTKKAVVNEALLQYVRTLKQARILDLFGSIDIEPDYDYRAARNAR